MAMAQRLDQASVAANHRSRRLCRPAHRQQGQHAVCRWSPGRRGRARIGSILVDGIDTDHDRRSRRHRDLCVFLLRRGSISSRLDRANVAAMASAFLVAAAISRPFDPVIWWATHSSKVADEQWGFFRNAMAHAGENGIRYYIPDNNYQFADVFIVLFKGASSFSA